MLSASGTTRGRHTMLKRSFDVVSVLLFAAPVGLLSLFVALAVRLTSPGPALYWSRRVGADEREFLMPKFRTMRTDTPQVATHLLTDAEKWLTPIGSFLRKSSLDELPQLYSVLVGDMSLVGPRPALFNQHDLIEARRECGVAALRPGITGWAQVNGRDELSIPEKVAYDRKYLVEMSSGFDFRILVITILNVMRRRGVRH